MPTSREVLELFGTVIENVSAMCGDCSRATEKFKNNVRPTARRLLHSQNHQTYHLTQRGIFKRKNPGLLTKTAYRCVKTDLQLLGLQDIYVLSQNLEWAQKQLEAIKETLGEEHYYAEKAYNQYTDGTKTLRDLGDTGARQVLYIELSNVIGQVKNLLAEYSAAKSKFSRKMPLNNKKTSHTDMGCRRALAF